MLDIWLHSGFSYDMQKKVSQKRLKAQERIPGFQEPQEHETALQHLAPESLPSEPAPA